MSLFEQPMEMQVFHFIFFYFLFCILFFLHLLILYFKYRLNRFVWKSKREETDDLTITFQSIQIFYVKTN